MSENNEDEDGDCELHQRARRQAKPSLGIVDFITYNNPLQIDITPFYR